MVGQGVDPVTGKERASPDYCDFFAISPDYYAVEIPAPLTIRVGQEPSWLANMESASGACANGLIYNAFLKDTDHDGVYELMHKNNLIGPELQRTLGWVDVDGDGAAELIDTDPYGGFYLRQGYTADGPTAGPSSATSLGSSQSGACRFERVQISGGETGLVPLACPEFDAEMTNVYQGVNYLWLKVEKAYGTVFLPRFR